jgi:hypothetical protein
MAKPAERSNKERPNNSSRRVEQFIAISAIQRVTGPAKDRLRKVRPFSSGPCESVSTHTHVKAGAIGS